MNFETFRQYMIWISTVTITLTRRKTFQNVSHCWVSSFYDLTLVQDDEG